MHMKYHICRVKLDECFCWLGDEYNIVIVNTVRSLPLDDIIDHKFVQPDSRWLKENLGFVMDPHQINVGITRAKHGLIIIGGCGSIIIHTHGCLTTDHVPVLGGSCTGSLY